MFFFKKKGNMGGEIKACLVYGWNTPKHVEEWYRIIIEYLNLDRQSMTPDCKATYEEWKDGSEDEDGSIYRDFKCDYEAEEDQSVFCNDGQFAFIEKYLDDYGMLLVPTCNVGDGRPIIGAIVTRVVENVPVIEKWKTLPFLEDKPTFCAGIIWNK